jgi:hypothetical protein
MKHRFNFFILTFIVIILLLLSCKNSSKRLPVKSTSDKELIGIEIPLSGSSCPIDIQIADSLIIIRDACDTFFYHVYNKNTLKLVGKFGKKGVGPFEYQFPFMMNQVNNNRNGPYVYIWDTHVNRIDCANVLKAINSGNYYPQTMKISKRNIRKIFPLSSAVVIADSFIVGGTQNDLGKGRFFCYEIANGELFWEPYYPLVDKTPQKSKLGILYSGKMALRPDRAYIAVASVYFKRIDILNTRCQLKRSVIFENQNDEPDFTNNSIPPADTYQYFCSITVSNNFIYALDRDKTTKIYELNMKSIRDTICLYKVDWEGNYVNRFKLTPRVLHIAVDEENHKIYGINEAYQSNSLFIYDMN